MSQSQGRCPPGVMKSSLLVMLKISQWEGHSALCVCGFLGLKIFRKKFPKVPKTKTCRQLNIYIVLGIISNLEMT